MNTETKVLHIRRATALDAVNIFKLIVDEEKRSGPSVALDDGSRIVDIIAAISAGYVSVATISGRIVGSIGALVSDTTGTQTLVGTFFVLSPSFHNTEVGSQLVSGLVRAAEMSTLPVRFTLPKSTKANAVYREALIEAGFEPKLVVWGYVADKQETGTEPTVDPDSGSDEVARATDADRESALPDAGATVEAA